MDFLAPFKGFHSLLCVGWVLITVPQWLSSAMPESQARLGGWEAVPRPWSCSRGCSGCQGLGGQRHFWLYSPVPGAGWPVDGTWCDPGSSVVTWLTSYCPIPFLSEPL